MPRTFKTKWFAKAARKARISDEELCAAIDAAMRGQADDLGGGVLKTRLDRNRSRSIILMRGRLWWVYAYLFAKKDRANIDAVELKAFRELATLYQAKTEADIALETAAGELVEICVE